MTWKRMIFKGKRVFVQVDPAGAPVLNNGRATMKYREEDDREYNPSPANLLEEGDGGQLGLIGSAPARKKSGRKPLPTEATPPEGAVVAYTDGGCIGNPGPAGLGYLVQFPDGTATEKGEPLGEGTNNIAELTAIWRVLDLVKDKNAPLRIHTDSTYAIGVLTQGWKAKANTALIADIKRSLALFSDIKLLKVKGHAGHPENERVDKLANDSARTQRDQ